MERDLFGLYKVHAKYGSVLIFLDDAIYHKFLSVKGA